MTDQRKAKIWKLYYHPDVKAAVNIFEDEVRVQGDSKTFLSVTEDGIVLSAGLPSKISIGSISPVYGGMARDTPWPMTLMASTASPPKQLPNIPLGAMLNLLKNIGALAVAFVP